MTYNLKSTRLFLACAAFLTLPFGTLRAQDSDPALTGNVLADFRDAKTEVMRTDTLKPVTPAADTLNLFKTQKQAPSKTVKQKTDLHDLDQTPDQWPIANAEKKFQAYARAEKVTANIGDSDTRIEKIAETLDASNVFLAEVKNPFKNIIAKLKSTKQYKALQRMYVRIDRLESARITDYINETNQYYTKQALENSLARDNAAQVAKANAVPIQTDSIASSPISSQIKSPFRLTYQGFDTVATAVAPDPASPPVIMGPVVDTLSPKRPTAENLWLARTLQKNKEKREKKKKNLYGTNRPLIVAESPKERRDSVEFERTRRLVNLPGFVKDKPVFYNGNTQLVGVEAHWNPKAINNKWWKGKDGKWHKPTKTRGYYQFKNSTAVMVQNAEHLPPLPRGNALATERGKVLQHRYANGLYKINKKELHEFLVDRENEGKAPIINRAYSVKVPNSNAVSVFTLTEDILLTYTWAGMKFPKDLARAVDAKKRDDVVAIPTNFKYQDFSPYGLMHEQPREFQKINEDGERKLKKKNAKIQIISVRYRDPAPTSEVMTVAQTPVPIFKIDTLEAKKLNIADSYTTTALDTTRVPVTLNYINMPSSNPQMNVSPR